jgi:hypothetical protein
MVASVARQLQPFIRFPLTRWQRLMEWDAFLVAAVLALTQADSTVSLRLLARGRPHSRAIAPSLGPRTLS